MPAMDGYAVCEALRADEKNAVLPVIMVTSSIGPEKTKASLRLDDRHGESRLDL
jgi:CheY-like chemotaxis protein